MSPRFPDRGWIGEVSTWPSPVRSRMSFHSRSLCFSREVEHKHPPPWSRPYCKTQNSGLRSKEEKRRDPINQPSRCNTQEGLLSVAQTGDSDLLGGRAHRTANWASFLYAKKKHTISILHTGYKVIGYMFAKQSYWYKLRGLHVYKAILLAQTSRALVQT